MVASLRNGFGSALRWSRDGASGALRRRDRRDLPLQPARREWKPLGHTRTGPLYAGLRLRTLSTTAPQAQPFARLRERLVSSPQILRKRQISCFRLTLTFESSSHDDQLPCLSV